MSAASLRAACIGFAISLALAAGGGTVYTEPKNARELAPDSIILVGRIELVPPLKAGEQDLKMGTFDPMDAKGRSPTVRRFTWRTRPATDASRPWRRSIRRSRRPSSSVSRGASDTWFTAWC